MWAIFAASLNGNAINFVWSAMVITLYALIPWTAVNLVDFFILRRGKYVIADLLKPNGVYGLWNMRGLISYTLGFIASIPFFVVPGLFIGPLATHIGGVDIGWVVGLVVAGGAYFLSGQKLASPAQLRAVAE